MRILREEIGTGTPLGRIFGSGTGHVGKVYGVTQVPVVKNQAIPAYDPRSIKGIGITYATSTMGADHTAGYAVGSNLMGVGGGIVDPLKKDGQVELSRHLQIITVMLDLIGLCLFIGFPAADSSTRVPALMDMLNARFGFELTPEWIGELGVNTLKTERAFNLSAGFTSKDDRLPEFFKNPLPPHNAVWDFTDEEIDAFWNFLFLYHGPGCLSATSRAGAGLSGRNNRSMKITVHLLPPSETGVSSSKRKTIRRGLPSGRWWPMWGSGRRISVSASLTD